MANNVTVLAVAALSGALAGAVCTLVLRSDRDAAPVRADSTDPELLMRLEGLSKAVEDLRDDLARRPAPVVRAVPVAKDGNEAGGEEVRRVLHEAMPELVDAPVSVSVPGGDGRDINAVPLEEVKIFDNWWNDRDLRRKWILTPQSEFLRRFGLPDSANAGGGVETWTYTVEHVDTETGETHRLKKTATFSNGRLMHVQ